jgi:glycosyltransferase involved in cell wall biosynthesis
MHKTPNLSQESEMQKPYNLNIALIGYVSTQVAPWDPDSTKQGLPGSEEAVVYSSQELAKQGHRVTVYMNPPKNSPYSQPGSNPLWLSTNDWIGEDPMGILGQDEYSAKVIQDEEKQLEKIEKDYDLVLMWRRLDVEFGRIRGKVVFHWPHDSPPILSPELMQTHHIPPFPKFDGICVLSQFHLDQYLHPNGYKTLNGVPHIISGNGIVPEHFLKALTTDRKPCSIGYFSNYSRGLLGLILLWPQIKKAFPEATLDICYGRETWGTMPEDKFNLLISKIGEYKDLGVVEHGKVGHIELAEIMMKTSVLAYPCNINGFTETFCITLAKCQAAGCIPVITSIGALNEIGHPEAIRTPPILQPQDLAVYGNKLIETLAKIKTDPEWARKERAKYAAYGNSYPWSRCVNKWLELYHRVTSK